MNGLHIHNPVFAPANLAGLWLESSMHVLRTAGEFWSGILMPSTSTVAPSRAPASTASPWWMPPQSSPFQIAPTGFATPWMPPWPQGFWSQALAVPGTAAATPSFFLPWLPSGASSAPSNPFAFWQKMWLDAATPAAPQSWAAPKTPVVDHMWEPVAAAYRTANGHAMAAVLRTMADVVEPKPQSLSPTPFWPGAFGTRH